MKNIKISGICLLLAACALTMTSCEKWFDTRPKTQVGADDMFASEAGFRDVLTGVYIQMTQPEMYGREMTFGMVDCLGRVYSSAGTQRYANFMANNYTTQYSRPVVDSAWTHTYAAIANLNIMIEALETADRTVFEPDNYNCIYGEALGLRAYLHFDMLRLYAPSPAVGLDAAAIPYVDEFDYAVTPSSTVAQVAASIIGDLEAAAELLKGSDPVKTGREPNSWLTLNSRPFHMNYYAVRATQARVHHWIGETALAAQCAREVIGSGRYTWTKVDNIATSEAKDRWATFYPEQIFALQVTKMEQNIRNILNYRFEIGGSSVNSLAQSNAWRNAVMPDAGDWRSVYFFTEDLSGATAGEKFNNKLAQTDGMGRESKQRMPLIRLPEMWLIVARCEPAAAVDALNEIRGNRGIGRDVAADTPAEQLSAMIDMEYLREFICEGVTFYNYKRRNSEQMVGQSGVPVNVDRAKAYLLPIPDQEKQFGGRE
jgi:hypothetical protein